MATTLTGTLHDEHMSMQATGSLYGRESTVMQWERVCTKAKPTPLRRGGGGGGGAGSCNRWQLQWQADYTMTRWTCVMSFIVHAISHERMMILQ